MSRKASSVLGMVSGMQENPEARKAFPRKCVQHDERGGLMDFKSLIPRRGRTARSSFVPVIPTSQPIATRNRAPCWRTVEF
jgi:hypothetical protein